MKIISGRPSKYILVLLYLSTVFGIVPTYNYTKKKLVYRELYKCYTLFLSSFATACSLASMYFHYLYGNTTFTILTVNITTDLFGITMYVSAVLGSSFWNAKVWDQLIRHLSAKLEKGIVRNGPSWKKPFISFIIGTVFCIYFLVYEIFIIRFDGVLQHFTTISLHYIKFVMISLVYSATLFIKRRYQALNRILLSVSPNVSTKTNVRVIQRVRVLSLDVDGIVEMFNSYFGWTILLLIAHSLTQILDCLSFFTSRTTVSFVTSIKVDFVLVTHLLSNIFVVFLLTIGCDNARKVSREIFRNCCDLKASVPLQSKEAEELDRLSTVVKKQTKFNAAGFFEIKRSVLLSVASAVTTYMIVIIQFDSLK